VENVPARSVVRVAIGWKSAPRPFVPIAHSESVEAHGSMNSNRGERFGVAARSPDC
jgi:hypothetical protein